MGTESRPVRARARARAGAAGVTTSLPSGSVCAQAVLRPCLERTRSKSRAGLRI